MAVLIEAETSLGIEEVVLLVDIEPVLEVEPRLFVFNKLIVVAVGLVAHMAVLHVSKDLPLVCDVIEGFDEGVPVQLLGIGVIVLIVSVLHQQGAKCRVAEVGGIAEVVAVELLY